ncbi:efflux RND transporter periplasmic adaptor subunit [Methylobrevis pamukkalensis]|uniref:efflux RND transporter periplasmic adaptor subunit n=1 Tax=Methylobrevis pamukkalensis TaxID=1439726 RepID=UPI001FDA0FF7|nr:HlyD family efflux transporter periplasmic adaptor subunit [Methylobrevis pamukkalensis]
MIAITGAAWWAVREQPAQVDVATVADGPMTVTIREEGMTRVRDIFAVSTPIAGRLSRTVLSEGDRVEGGKTIVAAIHALDPPLIDRRTEAELIAARDAARSGVGIAESELRRVETDLALAKEDLARALKLFDPGIISESALERATNEVERQEAAVEAARATVGFRQAELASAEARLLQPDAEIPDPSHCCINLLAPVDGTVLTIHARSEQAIAAGAVVAEIGDTSKLEIVVDLLSADAVRIAPGTPASIVEWGGEADLPATVRRIDPAAFTKVSALGIEEQRVNGILDFAKGDPRLGHGFRVVAELEIWRCESCLQIPVSALYRAGLDWKVFKLEDGRLAETSVAIGRMNDETAEVLSGLSSGDRVVVHPSDTLADGAAAEVRN